MTIQGISRQSGGAVIKLKSSKKYWKAAAGVLVSLLVLYFLFDFVDYVCNGVFVEWFTRNFVTSVPSWYDPQTGTTVMREEIFWPSLKNFIFWGMAVVAAAVIILVFVFTERNTAKIRREAQESMDSMKEEQKRQAQVIEDEMRRKDDLIAYLAHDLKTPLTSVIGYLSLLDEAPDMPGEQRGKYLHTALSKAERLEGLINEFFDITRYNLQKMPLEKRRVNLCALLVQVTEELYPVLEKHGNRVENEVDEEEYIYADPEKMARVFNNLLKNGAAYSDRDTPIKIWTRRKGEEIAIIFENTGVTIPGEKLEMIFDKFFRLDDARGAQTGGSGLGLASTAAASPPTARRGPPGLRCACQPGVRRSCGENPFRCSQSLNLFLVIKQLHIKVPLSLLW